MSTTIQMNVNERREIFCHSLTEYTPMCVNCAHYYPHFSADGYSLGSGHCVYPRIKLRRAYDTCKYFRNKLIRCNSFTEAMRTTYGET